MAAFFSRHIRPSSQKGQEQNEEGILWMKHTPYPTSLVYHDRYLQSAKAMDKTGLW